MGSVEDSMEVFTGCSVGTGVVAARAAEIIYVRPLAGFIAVGVVIGWIGIPAGLSLGILVVGPSIG